MTLCAIIDESGFEAGLYTGYFTLVDIRFLLFMSWTFNIQIVKALAVDQRNTQLF